MEQTEAFWLLASADRQLVLHELLERNGNATVKTLSRQVAARRHQLAPRYLTPEMVKRAKLRLVHIHFPHLLEKNIIDVDRNTEMVSLTTERGVNQLLEAATVVEGWPPTDLLSYRS